MQVAGVLATTLRICTLVIGRLKIWIDALLSTLAKWAAENSDILAVAIVGSYATGAARTDSDVDIVLIVVDPGTRRVVADGIVCLYDPKNILRILNGGDAELVIRGA